MTGTASPAWTLPQAEAIAARDREVLCTAGAGAGKTAVLAARVVALAADPDAPVDVDGLLLVTFTRAAAAEMRRRIAEALRAAAAASPRLQRQLWRLPQADITTLHGFCERTLRRHFAATGEDPSFRVLDEGEAALLLDAALDEVLEAHYAAAGEGDGGFVALVDRYGGLRLDGALRPLVLQLRAFARSMPNPDGWLAAAVRAEVDWAAARRLAADALRRCLERTERALAEAPEAWRPALLADREAFARLLATAEAADGPWDALAEALRTSALPRLAAVRGDYDQAAADRARRLRQANRESLEALRRTWGRPAAQHEAEAADVAPHLHALCRLARDVDAAYAAAKRRLGALDFDDLEHRCLRTLRGPYGGAVRARYAEVLVDEAQDLSPVQDELLAALCDAEGARRFTVGDVRQSIYGFRHAEPQRLVRRGRAGGEGGGRCITLPHNFRSRRTVLAAVNFVFGRLFAARGAGLPPDAAAPLVYAADYPMPAVGDGEPPVRLTLVEGDVEAESTAAEREAALVRRQVQQWLDGAWVHGPDGPRRARPGDVAVLLRAPAGPGPVYVEALRAAGIPCWSPAEGRRAGTLEGRTVIAWLQTLENPQQDVPLAATLLGPFGGFDAVDLALVRRYAPGPLWRALRACALGARAAGGATAAAATAGAAEGGGGWEPLAGEAALRDRVRGFLARLHAWRTAAREGAYAELLSRVLDESGYAAAAGALPGGSERRRTLQWCLDRCREADRSRRRGLAELIAHLQRADAAQTVAEAAAAAGDAVRVMSVHGAKGLEFPFVVVAGLGRPFRFPETGGGVLAHRDAGVAARAVDLKRRACWDTLHHAVVAARCEADARAEELRVLYVAMTRAREGLALVGTVKNLPERAGEWAALAEATGAHGLDLEDGASYLDWLMPVLARHADVTPALGAHAGIPGRGAPDPGGSRWEVHLVYEDEAAMLTAGAAVAPAAGTPQAWEAPQVPAHVAAAVTARLDAEHRWTYPWAALTRLHAKVSVGELRDRHERGDLASGEEEPAAAWAVEAGVAGPGADAVAAGAPGAGTGRAAPAGARTAEAGAADSGGWTVARASRRTSTRTAARAYAGLLRRPQHLDAGTPPPTEVGAAVHVVLRHVDLGGPCDVPALEACREDLVARGLLSPDAAAAVDLEAVARFLAGPLGLRLRAAALRAPLAVRREVPFAMRLPVAEVHPALAGVPAADGEWVLVQGVVDVLLVEDDGLLVADYKTDREGSAAAPHYAPQVTLYARAVAAAWRRPVREAWLCFLATGEDVRVPEG